MVRIQTHPFKSAGFTIVELLVVIVIIGVLALITTVAFNGIQKRAAIGVVQNTLSNAAKAMKAQSVEAGGFGTSFPSNVTVSPSVGLALAQTVDNQTNFCINAVYAKDASIQFHATQSENIVSGLCEGEVIESSIIGEYAGGEAAPRSYAGVAIGTGGGFEVRTDDNWNGVKIKWDAVSSATRYEVQYRTSASGTWMYIHKSTGAGNTGTSNTTSDIAPSVTSYDWPTGSAKPASAGDTYFYRYRSYVGGTAGDWYTATLTTPSGDDLPALKKLNLAGNSSWTGFSVSWTGNVSTVPGLYYELQYQAGSSAPWYWIRKDSGAGNTNASTSVTSNIDAATTSYNWPSGSAKPASSGDVYNYRIRVKSSTISGLSGPWTTASLTPPANSSFAKPSSLTITPTSSWAGYDIAWTADTSSVPSPYYEIQYRSSPSATWYWLRTDTGAGTSSSSAGTTANVVYTVTNYSFPSGSAKPASSGDTYEYRIRTKSSTITGGYSDWTTTSLTTPTNSSYPVPATLTFTQINSWAGFGLAWTGDVSAVPSYYYELQYRSSPSASWYWIRKDTGAGNSSTSGTTSNIAAGTNSVEWATGSAKPSVGDTYQYRIRAVSSTIQGAYSDWRTISVTR